MTAHLRPSSRPLQKPKPYQRPIRGIDPWHVTQIHRKISKILGFDTRVIANCKSPYQDEPNYIILTLKFRSKHDFERCRAAITNICAMDPPS